MRFSVNYVMYTNNFSNKQKYHIIMTYDSGHSYKGKTRTCHIEVIPYFLALGEYFTDQIFLTHARELLVFLHNQWRDKGKSMSSRLIEFVKVEN